ncbi:MULTISPECIES: hypothetical protein [Snodgrassella]|uniref:hypothetical protein n=1 Tax=Snodgrassella TaxID=1193515 RepID=UPI00159F0B61|nr:MULTISPECIES: hypothetical protein [Snodgrassella]MCO6514373.1 hypothetical protein [Snodgrassella sp.]WMY92037.1 hypothetical protein PYG29_01270 [Snodgrassella communis]
MKKQLDLTLYLVLDPLLCGGIGGMVNIAKIADFRFAYWFLLLDKSGCTYAQ